MSEQTYMNEGIDSWNSFMLLYNSALKEMGTKVEILNDEFQHIHQYNPIEYVKKRIKTPESIVKKLKRYGYESTLENMSKYVNDVAGVRIVCSFTSDIYRLADMIRAQDDITVLSIKDYIKNPKESGYKSYHMIVTIPIFLSDRVVDTKVEIQIRTIAMDFWASLEHKIYYKFEGNAPEYISRDLRECSSIVSMLDAKMLSLNEAIMEAKKEQGDPRPESWDRNAQAHTGDEDEDEISIQEEMEWNLHRSDLEDEDGALNQASVQADKKA
ncbi:MAG: GTP pyrophosphokinase family protein [Lachnospiraceae bacterium]|jgi:putative GTP pyrophosphokinase|nr:GTP pyrophosphokinase family protein [Lachnospiraceae bacterium]MEE3432281.1 GTP pyrophosphokinase family protein [Lachnospiraceae bacterium]